MELVYLCEDYRQPVSYVKFSLCAREHSCKYSICVNGTYVNWGLNVQFTGFMPHIFTDTDLQALVPCVVISYIVTFCINYS